MININKVDSIPQNAVKSKKGELTKKIYICGDETKPDGFNNTSYIFAKNSIEEILFENSYENRNYISTYAIIKNNGNTIKKETISNIDGYNLTVYGNFIIETEEPVEILRENSFYYIPYNPIELKPMPKIDKLIDSSSFENISTKLQEINDLLKVSSDNLKTIMDANNLMYEPTDNFSTLVKKLNNEPINFLLEGTKVRDILRKHMGTMLYAPDVGATYNDLMFTNSLPSDAQDLKEDLSQKQDGSILLLKKSISDGSRTYDTYYIYSNKKIYANKNSSYMFNLGVNYFNDIYFNNFYGEYIENASHLFDYVTYSNASAVYVTLNKFENVILNNLVNIDYMFNDCAIKLNRSITITNKIKTYNNFYSKFNSYQESYGSITLNYIDNESKKIAESIISEVNDNFVKLGTLVTQ